MKSKLLLLTVLCSSLLFAQNNQKSFWVGGGFNTYYTGAVAGDEFSIAGSEFEQVEIGDQITKVKFYHYLGTMSMTSGDVTFNNTQYTIKIYENPVLEGAYSDYGYYNTSIGTPVYTETITLGAGESDTFYEMTLTTPYTVNENEFWVTVCFDNGKGAMRLGEADANSDGKYYMYWDGSSFGVGTVLGKPNFGSFSEPEYHPLGISLYVDDGEPYVEQSDLTIKYLDAYPSATQYITEISIDATEDLIIYPVIINNGIDATSNTATVSATIGANVLLEETTVDLSGAYSLNNGLFTTIVPGCSITITATEMDTWELAGLFDICYTITYDGTDPVTTNNTSCLTVTRGEITATNCDLEAILGTSTTDFTPIPTSIAIGPEDDITFYPATKNNGPDEANNYAEVNILINGSPIDTYSKNLSGLTSGSTMALTDEGSTITADLMNLGGLTGSFEVCLQVSYEGTDGNTENNTSCVTITRTTGLNSILESSISVYPNPANKTVYVRDAENSEIYVLNILGEVMTYIENASFNQAIYLEDYTTGTYFIKVNSNVIKLNVIK